MLRTHITATTLLLTLLLSAACRSTPRINVSEAGKRQCREQQAELPFGTSGDEQRQQYQDCLKTIDRTLAAQAQRAKLEAQQLQQSQAAQSSAERSSWASPSDRLTHCLLVQQQVIRAEQARREAINPVMQLSKQYGVNSPEAQQANATYQQTLAELERLIPVTMRHGQPLLPTSVTLFLSCDRRQLGVDP